MHRKIYVFLSRQAHSAAWSHRICYKNSDFPEFKTESQSWEWQRQNFWKKSFEICNLILGKNGPRLLWRISLCTSCSFALLCKTFFCETRTHQKTEKGFKEVGRVSRSAEANCFEIWAVITSEKGRTVPTKLEERTSPVLKTHTQNWLIILFYHIS